MCTLIVLYRLVKGYPVVALFNRYAHTDSLEYPPRAVRGGKYVTFCPIDAASEGTWVGFNEGGLFAAVTDQHTGDAGQARRSRGRLILDVLLNFASSSDAANYIEREAPRGYKKGNYVIADAREAFHILYDGKIFRWPIDAGVYVVTNLTKLPGIELSDEAKEAFERAEARKTRALELAAGLESISLDQALARLKSIASDHGREAGRTSICYHAPGEWRMTSSTIMAVAEKPENSRILYCEGNPCSSNFIDYSHVLSPSPAEVSKKSERLAGRRIALCVTGSVAAIEAPKLARELRRHGAEVTCYVTSAGIRYGVSPKVMEWATRREVVTELSGRAEHLEDYDLVIVYPATLNTICKIASGVADNAVTTLCAATPADRLMLAPAMNLKLYSNPALKDALAKLEGLGATVLEPRIGEGAAKIAGVEAAVDHAIRALSTSRLRGRRVLVLAGPTRYDLDAVRYLSNKATGAIGYWLAKEAFWRGCDVRVIYGPGTVRFPPHISVVKVYSTEDALRETLSELERRDHDVAIFSAALLDFKPERAIEAKVRSGSKWVIELVPTPKVVEEVRRKHPNLFIVAFKLEYKVPKGQLIASARELLSTIAPGIVVANDLSEVREERHRAYIVSEHDVREVDGPKSALAKEILDSVERLL